MTARCEKRPCAVNTCVIRTSHSGRAVAIATLGELEIAVGRHDEALGHLMHVRELNKQFDSAWLSVSWVQLGTLAIMQGQLDDARELLNDGLTMSLDAESTQGDPRPGGVRPAGVGGRHPRRGSGRARRRRGNPPSSWCAGLADTFGGVKPSSSSN